MCKKESVHGVQTIGRTADESFSLVFHSIDVAGNLCDADLKV